MPNRFARSIAFLPLLGLTSACGGGGPSDGNPPPVIVAPTPAPTPTPTPTPPPAVFYDSAIAFDRNMTFQSPYVEVNYRERRDVAAPAPQPFLYDRATGQFDLSPGAATLSWNADKSATIRAGNSFRAYPSTSLSAALPNGIAFSEWNGTEGNLMKWGIVHEQARYLAGASDFHRLVGPDPEGGFSNLLRYRFFVIGSRTQDADLPTSGSFDYAGRVVYSPTTAFTQSVGEGNEQASLSIDLASGRVTGRWKVGPHLFDLVGTVSRSDTLRLSGTIKDFNGLFNGSFTGNLFGPQAKEAGLVLLAKSEDFVIGGQFMGVRP
ncbi:transferrin-binding protein-like solute binding protein [Sphingopyxis sp. 2PD]|uniref:transferrin-binding protein-like solute binding protein n=1 Tax=Sphingopyxis sp. 2PD TaxID=2502196 RepID=UPI0010F58C3D|nr:transferrin-binding protein-like solute binding protein [Sphingopyxis sp. 2PD]